MASADRGIDGNLGGDGFHCRRCQESASRSSPDEEHLLLRIWSRRHRCQHCSCRLAGSLRSLSDLLAIRLLASPYRCVDAPRQISDAVSDPDGQKRIARTTWNLLDHALEYGTRPYTGGIPAYRILKEGLFSSDRPTTVGKEMNDMRRRLERLELLEVARGAEEAAADCIVGSGTLRYDCPMRVASRPEDVIESFMMNGFRGGDFINEQAVPILNEGSRRARRDSLLCSREIYIHTTQFI